MPISKQRIQNLCESGAIRGNTYNLLKNYIKKSNHQPEHNEESARTLIHHGRCWLSGPKHHGWLCGPKRQGWLCGPEQPHLPVTK
jgi:hypothetical protein